MRKIVATCLGFLSFFSLVASAASIKAPNPNIEHMILKGSFYQMGRQYSENLQQKLIQQLYLSRHDLYPRDEEKKKEFERVIHYYVQLAKTRYPQEVLDFIQGETDSAWAKDNGIGFDDFVFLDQQFLFAMLSYQYQHPHRTQQSQACSFIALTSPNTLVARNFDYPKNYMRLITSYPLVLTMKHSDSQHYPNAVSMLTLPGVISQATLFNNKGYYISLNTGDTIGSYYKVLGRPSYLSQMMMTMFKAKDFTELKHWVKTTAPDLAYIVNIAGPGSHDIASIEDAPFNELQGHYSADNIPDSVYVARERGPLSNNTIEPELDYNRDFLVATNDYHLQAWEGYIGHPIKYPSSQSSYLRYLHLVSLLRARDDYSMSSLQQLMALPLNTKAEDHGALVDYCGTVEGLSKHASYYTVVFSPSDKKLSLRLQQSSQDPHDIGKTACTREWTDWNSFSLA